MKQQSIIAMLIVAFPAIAFCGESKRVLHKTVTVAAPIDQAFAAWATDAGAQQFFAANTRVVIRFKDAGNGRTDVDFTHAGWGEGEKWNEVCAYFDRAWGNVLANFKKQIESSEWRPVATRSAGAKDEARMREFAMMIRPVRPTFLQDATEAERARVGEHFEYLKRLRDEGTVILAGRCDDAAFGICVFRAADEAAAKKFVNDDPAVKSGVFTAVLHPFHVALVGKWE
jgi:uncharacterized protein YciI